MRKRRHHTQHALFTEVKMAATDQNQEWWDLDLRGFTDTEFIHNFRMSRQTFEYLCQRLSARMLRQDTHLRQSIPVSKRVGIGLYWLATGACYRTMSNLFEVAKSTVCSILHEFCFAVRYVLMPEYIKWPRGDDLIQVIEGFRQRWGFPQCAGAVDGSHIPITAPEDNHCDYFNRKDWHSVILQGVVDHKFCVHDARVLKNSEIHTMAERGKLFPPVSIFEHSEFSSLTEEQQYFNERQSRARMTVGCAFGQLKGQWRCLGKRACCTLHNVCEKTWCTVFPPCSQWGSDQVNKEAMSLVFLLLYPFLPATLWSTWTRVMEHCPA
uniref:Uncharacterized protein n=1 Tax=Maylandia zebra TaxID=106582 RepID=A0A3P9DB54_9CICH